MEYILLPALVVAAGLLHFAESNWFTECVHEPSGDDTGIPKTTGKAKSIVNFLKGKKQDTKPPDVASATSEPVSTTRTNPEAPLDVSKAPCVYALKYSGYKERPNCQFQKPLLLCLGEYQYAKFKGNAREVVALFCSQNKGYLIPDLASYAKFRAWMLSAAVDPEQVATSNQECSGKVPKAKESKKPDPGYNEEDMPLYGDR